MEREERDEEWEEREEEGDEGEEEEEEDGELLEGGVRMDSPCHTTDSPARLAQQALPCEEDLAERAQAHKEDHAALKRVRTARALFAAAAEFTRYGSLS
jgi:hypothetical protein